MKTVFLTTALGRIAIREQNNAIVQIELSPADTAETCSPLLEQAGKELSEYFAGHRKTFTFPWRLTEVPPFTEKVLMTLSQIPYGETVTYGQLAARAGNPKAARAVGQAVHRNPLPIVIPCHRVLATGGRIGGFAFGLSWKNFLLDIERPTGGCACGLSPVMDLPPVGLVNRPSQTKI